MLFFHQNNQFDAKTACFADFSVLNKIAVSRLYPRSHFLSWFFWLIFWNVENTLRILLKHSKFCSFIKTISLKQKQDVLRTFQFSPKSLYPDSVLRIFNFDQNRCIRTLPAWPFCWLIFLVEFFKCWKYPSNSSETFKILFFHQNNQFEAKTACFADFSILTKIIVSGLYRRGHFVGWFFWLTFSNVENTLRILLKHSKFCSFIKNNQFEGKKACFADFSILTKIAVSGAYRRGHFVSWFFWLIFLVDFLKCWKYPSNASETFKILLFHQNNQFEAKTACFADFSIFTKITVSGPCRRGHFFGWFFEMLKIPFQFFWNIQSVVLSSKQSVWSKNSMFCGLFSFEQNRRIRTLPAGHFVSWFFWLIFWNVENTLRILLKHSKCCSFIKTISMFCGLFNFDQNRCIRTLPAWPFCWLSFWKLKIPFQFFWNIQNVVLSSKQSACFADFSIWPKSLYLDLTGVAILLVDFFGWFFEMLKIPFEFFWNIQNVVLSSKQWVWSKSSMFADFSILTKIAVSGPYRRGHFFCWFFEMLKIPFEFFWNIQNVVLSSKQSVWSKNSMFCGLFNFDQNRCIRTLPAWPFCWLSFSNVENTLPILLKHSKCCSFIKTISLKQKQHVLQTFQFWPKSLYPDLTGVAILWVDFFGWFFEMLKIPFEFFWNIQNVVLSSKQSVWSKNSMFCGLFNFDQNRCIRTLLAWPFFCWFLKCWKYPSNSSETLKMLFFHQNNQFEAKTACFADFSILTKIAVSGPYRRGHFVGWVFQMLKIPFQFFWNIQNVVLSSKQSVWRKNSMFCGLFNLTKIAVSGPYRRGHFVSWFFWLIFWNVENTLRILLKHSKCCSFIKTISLKQKQHVLRTFQFWPKSLYPDLTGVAILLVDFFGWFFEMLKIPFEFFWNIQNVVLSSKQSVWSKNSMFCRLFNFDQNRCIRTLPVYPFFWLIFWNVENTLRILLKHSKYCSFIKTMSLKQEQHVLRTFQFWPKSLYRTLPAGPFC